MRELSFDEAFEVGGGDPLTFTTPITTAVLNDFVKANQIASAVGGSFIVGWTIGTWFNNRYGISTKIVDLIT